MKTYTKYTEITVEEAFELLAKNKGPIEGFEFSDLGKVWDKGMLAGAALGTPFAFLAMEDGILRMKRCRRVEEINPREVPECVTPFPEDMPWLAYVPLADCEKIDSRQYYLNCDDGWNICHCSSPKVAFPNDLEGNPHRWAIDVRTDFAKEHFPEIVACYEDEPFMRPEPRYGYTDDGKEIVAAEGWYILPEGEVVQEGDEAWGSFKKWGIAARYQDFGKPAGVTTTTIRAFARRKSPIAEGHNPDGLTVEQVGTKDGCKLLPKSFAGKKIDKSLVELWDDGWTAFPFRDVSPARSKLTYRTKADFRDVLKEPEDEFEEWIKRIEEKNCQIGREMAREAYELGRKSASNGQY